jgi:hypothetical protein
MRLTPQVATLLLAATLLAGGCSRAPAPVAAPVRDVVRSNTKPQSAPPERVHLAATQAAKRESQSSDFAAEPRAELVEKKALIDKHRLGDIDESRAAAAGIRKLTGRHLVLFTDVPANSSVEELAAVFDAAFPRWCEQLGLDAAANGDWRMRGYLVKDQARFEAVGLWPADLPQFLNGYTRGREFWLYNQSSEYYRRHLMLHEGVHGIMFSLQRSSGPAWYMEGVAELLATHRWSGGKLTLPHFPATAAEVPKLGRIEILQTQFKAGHALYLRDVLALENRQYLENEPYAWSWAAAAFLFGHPAYRDRFELLLKERARGDLNDRLKQIYFDDARQLGEEWQVFVGELAHGYDFERTRLDFAPAKTTPELNKPVKLSIAADRGWQNTGVRLEAGKRYKLTAGGRYTLARVPKPWTSEPGGVTIRYHRGLPLGILLAVVRPEEAPAGPSPFFNPQAIGLGAAIEPRLTGGLYLRINDFAGELADNAGAAEVTVTVE